MIKEEKITKKTAAFELIKVYEDAKKLSIGLIICVLITQAPGIIAAIGVGGGVILSGYALFIANKKILYYKTTYGLE